MLRTSQLEPLPGGTRMLTHLRMVGMPLPRWLRRRLMKFMMYDVYKFDKALGMMAYMAAKRDQAAEAAPEPAAA